MAIYCTLSTVLGEKRIKQSELSRMTGIAGSTINALYHDKRTRITYNELNKICTALNCDIPDILAFVPDKDN